VKIRKRWDVYLDNPIYLVYYVRHMYDKMVLGPQAKGPPDPHTGITGPVCRLPLHNAENRPVPNPRADP